ncbi:MAG: hypothetical protein ACRC2T_20230 [Thermoguttaceae bacterium]
MGAKNGNDRIKGFSCNRIAMFFEVMICIMQSLYLCMAIIGIPSAFFTVAPSTAPSTADPMLLVLYGVGIQALVFVGVSFIATAYFCLAWLFQLTIGSVVKKMTLITLGCCLCWITILILYYIYSFIVRVVL